MAYTFEQNRRAASVLNRLVKSGCYTAQEALSQRGSMSKLLKRRPEAARRLEELTALVKVHETSLKVLTNIDAITKIAFKIEMMARHW